MILMCCLMNLKIGRICCVMRMCCLNIRLCMMCLLGCLIVCSLNCVLCLCFVMLY